MDDEYAEQGTTIAADGKPILVGDLVYSLLEDGEEPFGTAYAVGCNNNGSFLPIVTTNGFSFDGESLTHERPDRTCEYVWNEAEERYECTNCGDLPDWLDHHWDDIQAKLCENDIVHCPGCGHRLVD